HYAHIGTGELHLRPVLNLKDPEDIRRFRMLAEETAKIVKKYRGSLSGEHGDGRLRGEFIPFMLGEDNYLLLKKLKQIADPGNIMNPGKIIDTPPMDTGLRYSDGYEVFSKDFIFDYSADGSFQQHIEKCNGSGDCIRPYEFGGAMCPSYQATLDERYSTRGRANLIREIMGRPQKQSNSPVNKQILNILDACLACKACKHECPSAEDMAKVKSELLFLNYKKKGMSFSSRVIATIDMSNNWLHKVAFVYNLVVAVTPFSCFAKWITGISNKRDLPYLYKKNVAWHVKNNTLETFSGTNPILSKVILFVDEFINYYEPWVGLKAIVLLKKLGYAVEVYTGISSGRAAISKGRPDLAKKYAIRHLNALYGKVSSDVPLIGIEPSAILTFRDEYVSLLHGENQNKALSIAENTMLIEEFIAREFRNGKIQRDSFSDQLYHVVFHAHCHQKALSNEEDIKTMLQIPVNVTAEAIPSGCCGMAGSFGMEKKHYTLSMEIGNLVLFPYIRKQKNGTIIVTGGTSCRQQITDGTGKKALHPVEFLESIIK
ncbi:MAG: FAD-linked oxidase C-terminal domain-containing protein, partial [Bacteroidales bacterium]|nr:FAD-linked oxidase C-terminal domain-containing protein [Bacteroidales bacterium]